MDVNQAIVKILESVGVDHVFGGSGQVNGNMLLALEKSKDKIQTVIIRNEQAASFMACGYAMFSDKLGVCFATGGPGAFNLFSGLAVALSDSLPVLAITGYVSRPDRGKGALNESSGLHRTPDSQAMFAATTKRSFIIEDPSETCDILEQAINLAYEGRPGPVHIHVPKDMTVAEVLNFRPIRLNVKPVLPDSAQLKALSDALANAILGGKRIGVLIGYGTLRSHAENEVRAFVEEYQLPFMTTMDAKGVLPEDHPLCLGVYGTSGDPGANRFLESADLILALGNSFAQNATFGFRPTLFGGKTLLHVNIDADEINKVYKTDYPLVSNIKDAIAGIGQVLSTQIKSVTPRPLAKETCHGTPIRHAGSKIHPAELVKILSANLPADTIILGDAGSHMLWLNCYLHLTRNQRYQNPGSFGPMASHVNGAIGVKCANMDKTVVCGCGDGAYLMAGFELLTAVENNIPVVWVIFNNGEFNIIKKLLINNFGEHAYMKFRNPDYVKYAEACGARGFRVEKLEEFEGAFRTALSLKSPVLIDVVVESEVYPPFSLGKV
jgi:acetolactate synthase-1/2/3 large subunit